MPDIILQEMGDDAYARFVSRATPAVRAAALEHLGFPGVDLYRDPVARRTYPRTAVLQEILKTREGNPGSGR